MILTLTDPLDSDVHVSRWGRRRPFIVLGSLLTSIGLLGFGFVTTIYNQGVALALAVRPKLEMSVMCVKENKYNTHPGGGDYAWVLPSRKKRTYYLLV